MQTNEKQTSRASIQGRRAPLSTRQTQRKAIRRRNLNKSARVLPHVPRKHKKRSLRLARAATTELPRPPPHALHKVNRAPAPASVTEDAIQETIKKFHRHFSPAKRPARARLILIFSSALLIHSASLPMRGWRKLARLLQVPTCKWTSGAHRCLPIGAAYTSRSQSRGGRRGSDQ